MKVLHIEMGRHLYGGARQVAYLLDGLARYPGKHLLACAEGAEIMGAIANPAVRIFPLSFHGDMDLGFVHRLRGLIRTERPDLMHLHSRRGDALSILAGRAEHMGMVHSRRVDNPPRWIDVHLKFPCFERIITISEGIRRVLLEAGVPARKLVCIPSAVDTKRYQPGGDMAWFRSEFNLDSDIASIGVIAQWIPRKGHATLLDALPGVLRRFPRIQVLLFGKGPLEADLRDSIQVRGLESWVRLAGFRTDLERVLPCLDLVVHPAWMEGLGVSLLETAACGVPILASRAGGIPEVVENGRNGYLLEPGDASTLTHRMLELLTNPTLREELGRAGRERILQRFSLQNMVEGNFAVYTGLNH